jgi:hypothetical protein
VAVVQYTFTHKLHTENTERNKHNNKKVRNIHNNQKIKINLGSAGRTPFYESCCLKVFLFITFFYILLVTFFIISYVFLLSCITCSFVSLSTRILIVMCVPSCVFCLIVLSVYCLCVNVYWTTATGISGHFSTTVTEVFPCFILSCKANARV